MDSVWMLWPERRRVTADTIQIWYHDAVANEKLDSEDASIPDADWKEQAMALHRSGEITLQRW